MQALVDSSVWIDYFRGGGNSDKLDFMIEENVVVINDLILAEIIPFLKIKNQRKLIRPLKSVYRFDLNIDWEQLIEYQHRCLKKGVNGIGIPDLIIAQNANQNGCPIYSLDHHFKMMRDAVAFELIG